MANGISPDPRDPIQPIQLFPAASTSQSAMVDAYREGGCAGPAVAGSWLDADASIELEYKRALGEALAAEEKRLRERLAVNAERLVALDAEMHLALARGREDQGQAAIRQIISERRRSRSLSSVIERIRQERTRLTASILYVQARRLGRGHVADSPPTHDPIPQRSGTQGSASSRNPAPRRDSRRWI